MLNDETVPLSTAPTAGLEPPIWRDWFTASPLLFWNVIVERGSSTPALPFWSTPVAVGGQRPGIPPICVGTLAALSTTSNDRPNVLVAPCATPVRSRYLLAILPLLEPFVCVVMSFPAAWLSVEPLPAALL